MDILVKSESGNNPWEFNVRDILRWCSLMLKHQVTTLVSLYLTDDQAFILFFVLSSTIFVVCRYVYLSSQTIGRVPSVLLLIAA